MAETADVQFIRQHVSLVRRHFLKMGATGALAIGSHPLFAAESENNVRLQQAIAELETWLTKQNDFQDVSRGNPKPHKLSEEKRREVGLTRETWRLEVNSDQNNPARLRSPLTRADNTALDFDTLIELGKTHAVRFAKVMTCLNKTHEPDSRIHPRI